MLFIGSRFGSGNVPLRAARSSVEGLNQEIERLVLYPASGTQTTHLDRLRDKVCKTLLVHILLEKCHSLKIKGYLVYIYCHFFTYRALPWTYFRLEHLIKP